jgi:hypothetical protein
MRASVGGISNLLLQRQQLYLQEQHASTARDGQAVTPYTSVFTGVKEILWRSLVAGKSFEKQSNSLSQTESDLCPCRRPPNGTDLVEKT